MDEDFFEVKKWGKLHIAGLSLETTDDGLDKYFSAFGQVADAYVQKSDDGSNRSRGFGFVTFFESSSIEIVLSSGPHQLDGRTIDPQPQIHNLHRKPKYWANRLFLAGLPPGVTEVDLRLVLEPYGKILAVSIIYDRDLKRNRGFGFVSFHTAEPVERLLAEEEVDVNGKRVIISRARPKNTGGRGDCYNCRSNTMMTCGNGKSKKKADKCSPNLEWQLVPKSHPGFGMGYSTPEFFGPTQLFYPFSTNLNNPQQGFEHDLPMSSSDMENLQTALLLILKSYDRPPSSKADSVSLDICGDDDWVEIDLTLQPPHPHPGKVYGRLISPLKAKSNFGCALYMVYLFIIFCLISSYFFRFDDQFPTSMWKNIEFYILSTFGDH